MVMIKVASCTWIDQFNLSREREEGCATPPLKRYPPYHKWQNFLSDHDDSKCVCKHVLSDLERLTVQGKMFDLTFVV